MIHGQVKNSETSKFCFRLFLFRLFAFDLILKIENLEEENLKKKRKKKKELSALFQVSEFSICHFLEFLIKCPKFKFQSSQISVFRVFFCFPFLLCLHLILQGIGLRLFNLQIHIKSHKHYYRAICTIFKVDQS